MISRRTQPDHEADAKAIRETNKPDEVEAALAVFDKPEVKGYVAFTVHKDRKQQERTREFKANAGSIIMAPSIVGR